MEKVQRVQEPYKNANRKFHPDDTVIDVRGRKMGGSKLQIIAGPCSVESEEQLMETAIACGSYYAPRRRIQAKNLAILLPGSEERGHRPAAQSKGVDGAAYRHRDNVRSSP